MPSRNLFSPDALRMAEACATDYLRLLPSRPVRASAGAEALLAKLDIPLQDGPLPADEVVRELVDGAEPGLVASSGPRYFGFVTGGTLPAVLAADWLTSAWDQNAGMFAGSPAAAVVEDVVARWILRLLGLPATASVGFVTGCQMANFTALAAARHALLAREGWDVEARGLQGAPPLRVVAGEEAHVTIFSALAMLGLGREPVRVAADAQGRLEPEALARELARSSAPTIVCAQAGNVNTGAFDPLRAVVEASRRHGAWVHVDGAFGLWAAASDACRPLADGLELADSWATDAHKWLNVSYDSGIAIVADAAAHRAATSLHAAYLVGSGADARQPMDWVPEASRRARGFPLYAALRSLGRRGVAEMVDRCCALARRFAGRVAAGPSVDILNEVALNQVLVRFSQSPEHADAATRAVIDEVQRDGTCWLGGTSWHGVTAMRVSVSNWATTEEDIDRSAAAVLGAWERVRARR